MYISSLTLQNYRVFEDFLIGFHPRLTVLAGVNGCGKTTVLEAIYNSQDGPEKMSEKAQPRFEYVAETDETQKAFPVSADVTFDDPFVTFSWTKHNNTDVDHFSATPLSEGLTKVPPVLLLKMIHAPQFDMPDTDEAVAAMVHITNRFVSRFGFSVTEVSGPENIVVRDETDTETDLVTLGGGTQNLMRLGLTLASATVSDNHKHSRALDAPAPIIACIDNIELHLHPAWQQLIVPNLLDAFPEAQFVVTTHSSIVLSTVHSESIRTIERDADGILRAAIPHNEVVGTGADSVLASVLKTSPIPDTPQRRKINHLIQLIESGDGESAEVNKIFSWLVDFYGEYHPIVIDAKRRVRFQELKQKMGR